MGKIIQLRSGDKVDTAYGAWFEQSDDCQFIVAVSGPNEFTYQALNRAYVKRTGVDPSTVLGKRPHDCFASELADAMITNFRRCVSADKPIRHEVNMTFPSGLRHWQTVLTPIHDAQGKTVQILGSARDCAAEIEARERAETNRQLLQGVVDAAPDVIYIVDIFASRLFIVGGPLERTLGYTVNQVQSWPKEILNKSVHPGDVDIVAAHRAWTKRMADEDIAVVELRVRRFDGTYIWISTREKVFSRDKDGRVTKVMGVATSIQQKKDSERSLRIAHINLRRTLQSITDCYFTLDRDYVITDVNQACLDWMGVKREKVSGVSFWDLCKQTDMCGGLTMAVMNSRRSMHGAVRSALRPDRWLDYHAYPSEQGVVVLFHDITEQKIAEEEAARSKALLSATLDALSANIAILDQDGVIVDVNAAWHRFAVDNGYADEHHGVGQNYLAICRDSVGSDPPGTEIAENIESVLAGEKSHFSLEYLCGQRWCQLRASRFEANNASYVAVAHEDITELAVVRESLATLDADKHRKVSQILRQLVVNRLSSSIAHELNQPLSAIMWNAETVLLQLTREHAGSADTRELLTDIANGARRAADVINRVRHLINDDATKFEIIEIEDLLQSTHAILRSELVRRRTVLVRDSAPAKHRVRGDFVQLQQIFINLIMNAMEAMGPAPPTGPHHKIVLTTQSTAEGVRVIVSDHGPGLPKELHGALFEPFVSTKSEGMGLGLSICANIAEAHGGGIVLENKRDGGASAILTLPVAVNVGVDNGSE